MSDANALKDLGNKAFAAKEWDSAIGYFTQAVALDPTNHVLYSNRSAAHAGKKEWIDALKDAEECIKVNPKWAKGYARKGAALHGARRYDDAIVAYEEGLKLEDSPALRKGLKEVRDAKEAADEPLGLGKMFSDPQLLSKLAANPRTQKHLADPSFMQMLQMIQQNPKLASNLLQSDPRMIDVLGVAMGIDIQGYSRPEGSDELPPGVVPQDTPGASSRPPPTATSTSPKFEPQTQTKSSSSPPPPSEDVEMLDDEEATAKRDAEAAKKLGSEAYKRSDFAVAAEQFAKAWDLSPKDITYLTNLGAAYLEQGEYDKAIEACEKAVDEGRSLRADFKLIAKALGRIGSVYLKKSDLSSAIKYFEKSLSEHRTPDVLNKLRDAQRAKTESDRLAYIDPEKGAAAREEGNTQFKAGSFVDAVKSYTEAIKRDPDDPRGYNNRAAAYQKLVALPEALKDAEAALKIDPSFVKAYIRKSAIMFGMREYTKAIEALHQAEGHDPEGKHKSEIQQQILKCQQAMFTQRAGETEEETFNRLMRDPEVAGIMSDPVMQQILQQEKSNPGALQNHMKNPVVRAKILKLIEVGVIQGRWN